MKKFLSTMILAVTLVIVGSQQNQAEAGEYYVGSYNDGTAVYLITESVARRSWARSRGYECNVRAGGAYLKYTFWCPSNNVWQYENSEGYKGYAYDGSSPVARAICNYILGKNY